MKSTIEQNRKMTTQDPYSRCASFGPGVLTDAELLAIMLRTGYGDTDAVQLAEQLLATSEGRLAALLSKDITELTEYQGIGRVKAVTLLALLELSKRISRENCVSQLCLNSPRSIADYYMEQLRHNHNEQFLLCLFDSQYHLMDDIVLSSGTVRMTSISPREIFSYALRHHAVYIVMLHNHPGGICKPSEADIALTEAVAASGELLFVPLVDHIIIGDQSYYSFKEEGLAIR
ncbi:MAG: DNA repair protein RadC [Lachnospiraceae bacterium]|nr:DNA repair protein RadC [Lachnospiraceae bacterium]